MNETGDPRLIVLDTTGRHVGLELCQGGTVVAALQFAAQQHVRQLTAHLRRLMTETGWTWADVAAIGVNTGPGSFTGIRVGLAVAKALAYVGGLKLIAVDMFDALAQAGRAETIASGATQLDVLLEGQLRTVTAVRFSLAGINLARGIPRIIPVEQLAAGLDSAVPVLGRLERITALIPASVRQLPDAVPALLPLVLERFRAGLFADPFTLEPYYVRPSSAEEKWDARA